MLALLLLLGDPVLIGPPPSTMPILGRDSVTCTARLQQAEDDRTEFGTNSRIIVAPIRPAFREPVSQDVKLYRLLERRIAGCSVPISVALPGLSSSMDREINRLGPPQRDTVPPRP